MLLRDLWGPRATLRFPIKSGLVPISLFTIIGGLTLGPLIVIGNVAIWAVEKCQGRFCGDVIETDNGTGDGVELEEGERLVGDDGENGGEASGIREVWVSSQRCLTLSKEVNGMEQEDMEVGHE